MKLPIGVASFPLRRFLTVLLPRTGSGCREGWLRGPRGIGRGPHMLPWAEENPCPPECRPLMLALQSPCSRSAQGLFLPTTSALAGPRDPQDLGGYYCLHICWEDRLHLQPLTARPHLSLLRQAHKLASSAVLGVCLEDLRYPL